jgi:hypothetical protein
MPHGRLALSLQFPLYREQSAMIPCATLAHRLTVMGGRRYAVSTTKLSELHPRHLSGV